MPIQTTFIQGRDALEKLIDQVTHSREIIMIHCPGEEEVTMIAVSELESQMETAYLFHSSINAECYFHLQAGH